MWNKWALMHLVGMDDTQIYNSTPLYCDQICVASDTKIFSTDI